MEISDWEQKFQNKLNSLEMSHDPAHDVAHFHRVVRTAKRIASEECANLEIVVPAAWLHDLVNTPKNHPDRKKASILSADEAVKYLTEINYPSVWHSQIHHAIEAHSYSAQIEAQTLEAKVVQDADRLDSLGAIGTARCLSLGGFFKRSIYDPMDPFAMSRALDDGKYTIDHFFNKLLKLEKTFQTPSGRKEARKRTLWIEQFLEQFKDEIT